MEVHITEINSQDNEVVNRLIKESFKETEEQFKHLMVQQVVENPVIWILFGISLFCLTPFCGSLYWGVACGFGAMLVFLCVALAYLYYRFSFLRESNIDKDVKFPGSYAGFYSQKFHHMILAKYKGEVVGCCALIPGKDSFVCELVRMSITKPFRRLGIGQILEQKIIDVAKIDNYKKIALTTSAFLTAANKFYQHCGYRIIEVRILVAVFPWHWDLIDYCKELQ